jgi:hypothetical protein
MKFLEQCFKGGLLEYWSLVSVHPYRQKKPPETAGPEYERLRAMIDKYAPNGKKIPIISGEWGYTTTDISPELDGKFLPRLFLSNLMSGLPLSIWYDWHDDGRKPDDREHNFGTVKNQYFEGRDPVYDPKPAYVAVKVLAAELGGFTYARRITTGDPGDYVLQFNRGHETAIACWTTSTNSHSVTIEVKPGPYELVSHTGDSRMPVTVQKEGARLQLTDAPQYLIQQK